MESIQASRTKLGSADGQSQKPGTENVTFSSRGIPCMHRSDSYNHDQVLLSEVRLSDTIEPPVALDTSSFTALTRPGHRYRVAVYCVEGSRALGSASCRTTENWKIVLGHCASAMVASITEVLAFARAYFTKAIALLQLAEPVPSRGAE